MKFDPAQTFLQENIDGLSVEEQKLLLEQTEKKYNLLLADDQSIRARIQSINAISIGLIVLLVGVIHNKEWYEQADNYFVALVLFLAYNALIFFLSFIFGHKIGGWSVHQLLKDSSIEKPNRTKLSQIYGSRITYYDLESQKLSYSTHIIRIIFLIVTVVFGSAIVGFYCFAYL